MIRLTRFALALLGLSLALATAGLLAAVEVQDGARCGTDSECSLLCRPDDEECDGGPQDEEPAVNVPSTNFIIGVRA